MFQIKRTMFQGFYFKRGSFETEPILPLVFRSNILKLFDLITKFFLGDLNNYLQTIDQQYHQAAFCRIYKSCKSLLIKLNSKLSIL
jgi:hypothetical protein